MRKLKTEYLVQYRQIAPKTRFIHLKTLKDLQGAKRYIKLLSGLIAYYRRVQLRIVKRDLYVVYTLEPEQ